MSQDNATAAPILRQLKRLTTQNRGQIGKIEKRLGFKGNGKIARYASGGRGLKIGTLGAILDGFDEAPEEFFGQAFDLVPRSPAPLPAVGSGRWLLDTLQLGDDEPGVIQQLSKVAEALPATTPVESPGKISRTPFTRDQLLAGLTEGSLARRCQNLRHPLCRSGQYVHQAAEVLDDLRYSKPQEAAALAHELAVKVCPSLPGEEARDAFATAIGVFASAHRIAASHETAARALAVVCDSASPLTQGDLLLRMATLLRSHGRYPESLSINTDAMQIFLAEADVPRMGQVCVDRGVAWMHSGDHTRSEASFSAGLALLSPNDCRNRATVAQGFASVALAREQPSLALEHLEFAQQYIAASDLYSNGMTAWFRGAIQQAVRDFAGATSYFRQAQEMLWPLNVFDWALVTLDLLEVLLAQGSVAEARYASLDVARLLEPHSSNRIAVAAMNELLRIRSTAEGLDPELFKSIRIALRNSKRLGRPARGAWTI